MSNLVIQYTFDSSSYTQPNTIINISNGSNASLYNGTVVIFFICQLYTASQTNLKGNRKYFTKEISYLSYISSDPFLMKPNIIVARHN